MCVGMSSKKSVGLNVERVYQQFVGLICGDVVLAVNGEMCR